MRWGIRKQHAAAAPSSAPRRCEEEDDGGERGSNGNGKGKGRGSFSFSPLSWLAKLAAAKDKPGAGPAAKRAPAPPNKSAAAAAAAPAFPSSCIPKRTSSPSPAAVAQGPSSFSPPRRSAADAVVPRRLSVGNDSNAGSVAARRRHGRRHCSVGGDRELPPLGRLIPFSLAGSPAAAPPSDTDAAAAGGGGPARASQRRRHRRRRSTRRLSVSGGGGVGGGRRPSFSRSGRMLPPRARAADATVAPGLPEGLAVVRRTRDPQRAFRESMVEMIASASGGGGVGGHGAAPPRAEELERLLACYLSLNADEHHDCIVKVFRQVWFEYVSLLPRPEAGGGRRRRHPPTARRC